MRKVLILLIMLLPVMVCGKDKKDKKKIPKHFLPGRWVEVKRLTLDSVDMPFKDTLFMTFQIRDTFTYRVRNGFVYRGKYTIDDDGHLDFGTASYEVVLRQPAKLIFTNGQGIYFYVPDTSDTAQVIVLEKEEKILPVPDIDLMIGHWTVYKRTIDKDGGGVDFSSQIKSAYITGPSSDDKQGLLFCGNDPDNAPTWYIKGLGTDQSLECNGKNQRFLKVVKCQKGEMILEENGVSYYFKQFK